MEKHKSETKTEEKMANTLNELLENLDQRLHEMSFLFCLN